MGSKYIGYKKEIAKVIAKIEYFRWYYMSNIGVGVDIEDIERFRLLNSNDDERFLNKIFTKNELKYCFSKTASGPHLAARFAGKEAVLKALSAICDFTLNYKEIEIINNEKGVPIVLLNNKKFNKFSVKLSLSHCKDKTVAFSIAIKVQ